MYIPPAFIVITCEPVDEAAFRAWAEGTGGVWHSLEDSRYHKGSAHSEWDFGPYRDMEARLKALTEEKPATWIPRELMHTPPHSLIEVELSESMDKETAQYIAVLQSLFDCWASYAYDLGCHEWVSALLRDLLPAERIIRCEPPPPRPPTPWIWVGSKYIENEAYHDNDTAS